jgi:ferrochelatase
MKVEDKKKAVLLMAYGSPDRDEDVEPYYTHIRGGRKPTQDELENLRERYKKIGGRSPLLRVTNSTAKKLEERVSTRVYVGMKHWHPYISETFEEISSDDVAELTAIALAPHYSKMSIGSYQDAVRKASEEKGNKITLRFVDSWHLDPVFIEKWRQRILQAYEKKFPKSDRKSIFFLFTAHSLPERILTWNDPYKDQLLDTAKKLAFELKLEDMQYGFAFQSAGHTHEPWLGPDILEKLKELDAGGWKSVLVLPIGFVSDHLEILFDIDCEAQELARGLGMHLERTQSFNDESDFIDILESVLKNSSKK